MTTYKYVVATRLARKHQIMNMLVHIITVAVVICLVETDADVLECAWNESDETVLRRRRAFCRSVEGFVEVCRCNDPVPIVFSPPAVSADCHILSVNRIIYLEYKTTCLMFISLFSTKLALFGPAASSCPLVSDRYWGQIQSCSMLHDLVTVEQPHTVSVQSIP